MQSPALAIAWEFRRKHRWGLIALMGILLLMGTIIFLMLKAERPTSMDVAAGSAAFAIVPLAAGFMYFLAVFSFGFSADLGARDSIYPARMFTLPVSTAALAGWPMLYGTVTMAALWLATAFFAIRPWGVDVPLIWPALLAAAFLAWTQALMWMPYGLPGLRIIVAVVWLGVLVAAPQLAVNYEVPEAVLISVLAALIPAAYVAAWFAVGRARRGDVPDWRGIFAMLGRITDVLPRWRDHFSSSARAQVWFEWRRHGWSLPLLVGILLPFGLTLLFVATNDMPEVVFYTLLGVLLTPPFMAGFAAATVSKSNPYVRDYYGVTAFTATRPLTSSALIAAKLKMAVWSTLAAWLLILIAIPLALTLSGNWPVVMNHAGQWIEAEGPLRATVIVLLVVLGLLAVTWKQLVQNLYIGLTGREWLIKSTVFLALAFLICIGPITSWIAKDKEIQKVLWDALPWIAGVLVCLKLSAAGWIASRLHRRRLVSDHSLATGAACWLVVVLALYGLLAWLVITPLVPRYLLALGAILAIPLTRLSAAPLALVWNRHR